MKQFLITVAGVLVGMILFVIVVPIVLFSMLMASLGDKPALPGNVVLALDLRGEINDQPSQSPFAAWGDGAQSVLDIVQKLDHAAHDPRVKGVFVRAQTVGMSGAHAEEIRSALAAFQASGKFVIAHISNEGSRMSIAGYTAIAGADEIWLQAVNGLMPMGISAEEAFLGETMRRFRLQPQIETREEYKSAPSILTETGFTPADREQTQALLDSFYATMLADIAADRGLTPAAARAAIEQTPIDADAAVRLKLVDKLGQAEDAADAARARAENAEIVELAAYDVPRGRGPVIAVVTAEGEILNEQEDGGFGGPQLIIGDQIAGAIHDAADDEDVRAIIFRVSSPGGSPAASDQILAAVRAARAAGKKVVVSMGDVAASGGYYISAEADEIVASAMTITGSIGIFGGKVVIGPALDHYLSVRTDAITVGSPLVRMMSPNRAFTNQERVAYAAIIDRIYNTFMGHVAAGRRLTVAQVREVARGRVWTGAQAKANGLVDHLGGFSVALQRARALAEIPDGESVQLRFYPEVPSPFEALQHLFGASAESARAAAVLSALVGDEQFNALIRAARDRDAIRARAEGVTVR